MSQCSRNETCMGPDSSFWIDNLHEQIKNKGFIFTDIRFLVWILTVLLYILDLISSRERTCLLKFCWFVFCCHFVFLQYVFLVSYLLCVSCTETKVRYLLNNRDFGQRMFCLWHTVNDTSGEFSCVTLKFWRYSCHVANISLWHLPLITTACNCELA